MVLQLHEVQLIVWMVEKNVSPIRIINFQIVGIITPGKWWLTIFLLQIIIILLVGILHNNSYWSMLKFKSNSNIEVLIENLRWYEDPMKSQFQLLIYQSFSHQPSSSSITNSKVISKFTKNIVFAIMDLVVITLS